MDPGVLCPSFLFLVAGLCISYISITRYRLMQKIKNTPTSKIRSAAVGLIELFGKAKCKEEIYSPISKIKCVFWDLKAESYHSGDEGWGNIYKSSLFNKKTDPQFYLEDETGKIIIDPRNIQPFNDEIEISPDLKSEGTMKQLDSRILAYMEENIEFGNVLKRHPNDKIRIIERYIAENDEIYVIGSAMPLNGVSSHISNENLVVKKNDLDRIFYISDLPEGGKMFDRILFRILEFIILGFVAFFAGMIGILAWIGF